MSEYNKDNGFIAYEGPSRIINDDCMASLDGLHADAVICDPPFGTTACKWDKHLDWPVLWKKLWGTLGERGVIVIHASHPFTHRLISSQVKHHKYNWVWRKNLSTNFFHAKRQPLRSHEEIVVFYKKPGQYFPQMSEGHEPTQSSRGSSDGVHWSGTNTRNQEGGKTSRFPQTVLDFPVVDPKCRQHPSEKPLALVEYLVSTYTRPGETVLDFTMGSGTTAIACINKGRRFIGIEKDPQIFKSAQERISKRQNQKTTDGHKAHS